MRDYVKERVEDVKVASLRGKNPDNLDQIKKLIKENQIEFMDLRFTDLRGKEHHVTLPLTKLNEDIFEYGKAFDGSSLCGWQEINESDLLLMLDTETAVLDPFSDAATLNIRCDVYNPRTRTPYH